MVVKYVPGSASTTDRENGFIETIQKEFPGIHIVDSKYGQDTVETALQATEDLLTKNKDVQGLYACNAPTAVGALQALQSQHRAEIKMVGFDAEKALVGWVESRPNRRVRRAESLQDGLSRRQIRRGGDSRRTGGKED